MPNQSIISTDVADRYEVFEWRNALAILSSAHPDKWANFHDEGYFEAGRMATGRRGRLAQSSQAGLVAAEFFESEY